ncbi:MAG: hypothetical protein QM723_10510 [Myxococcaceae bacterium]
MRALLVAVAVMAWAACSSSAPIEGCRTIVSGAGGGGGDSLGIVGTAGSVINASFRLQLPSDCEGKTPNVTRVDVSVLDPSNHPVNASATAPMVTFSEVSTTVTFTPMTGGTYHVVVRFDPNLGTVQRDLIVADAGAGGGAGGGGGNGGGGSALPPECDAGTMQVRSCGHDYGGCRHGEQQRACDSSQRWIPWTECSGATFNGAPFVPGAEVCGNQLDDDCNGFVDEGCACNPAAVGAGGPVVVNGAIHKMKSDQVRCRIYALDLLFRKLLVFDTATKAQVQTITLPGNPTDFDVSPDGRYIVVGQDTSSVMSVDPDTFAVTQFQTNVSSHSLEVGNDGFVYFIDQQGGDGVGWLDLESSATAQTMIVPGAPLQAELELAPYGFLYAGGYDLLPGEVDLDYFHVDGGSVVRSTQTATSPGSGVPFPERKLYLSPSGFHLYYGLYQWNPFDLHAIGFAGEAVLVEDPAGTFAIGTDHAFDAAPITAVGSLGKTADAAALSADSHEVWLYSGGVLTYQNIAELVPP